MKLAKNQQQLRFAILLAIFSGLGPFTIDMYLPAFPQLMQSFDTSASVVQMSLTACILGLSLGQIVMGALSDVYGRRIPLIYGMIIFLISSLGCAFAPNVATFIALRFIQGLSAAAGIVISRAIVRDIYQGSELAKFFSLLMTIGNLAPLVAPLAGSAVIGYTGWVGVFIFLACLGLILTFVTTWKIKESLPVAERLPSDFKGLLRNFAILLRDRKFMGYALAPGIMVAGVFAYVSGTPFIYQKIYGVSPQVFSMLFALNGISLILGAQVARWLTGRVANRLILLLSLAVACIASIAVLIVVLVHGPLYSLVIPLSLFVVTLGMASPISSALAMESQGHIAGSAAALLGVIPQLLGSITSPLVGIAGEYSAIPLGVIICTTSFLGLIVYLVLIPMKKGQGLERATEQVQS